MSDLSVYSFTGRLTHDAEYRTLASGKGLLTANVAINTGYGDYRKVTFIKVNQWGESGIKIQPYLTKGTLVSSTGEPSINRWTGKDGTENTELQVDVRSIQILASKKKDDTKSSGSVADEDESTLPAF